MLDPVIDGIGRAKNPDGIAGMLANCPPAPVGATVIDALVEGTSTYAPLRVQRKAPRVNKYALCRCGSYKVAADCCGASPRG